VDCSSRGVSELTSSRRLLVLVDQSAEEIATTQLSKGRRLAVSSRTNGVGVPRPRLVWTVLIVVIDAGGTGKSDAAWSATSPASSTGSWRPHPRLTLHRSVIRREPVTSGLVWLSLARDLHPIGYSTVEGTRAEQALAGDCARLASVVREGVLNCHSLGFH
jgi:hypothetical protein